eukprot:987707_1
MFPRQSVTVMVQDCPVKPGPECIWSLITIEFAFILTGTVLLIVTCRRRWSPCRRAPVACDLIIIRALTYVSIFASCTALFFELYDLHMWQGVCVLVYQMFVESAFVYFT